VNGINKVLYEPKQNRLRIQASRNGLPSFLNGMHTVTELDQQDWAHAGVAWYNQSPSGRCSPWRSRHLSVACLEAGLPHRPVLIRRRRCDFHSAVHRDEVMHVPAAEKYALFLGVAAFLFLVMYGVSAAQMAHPRWFSMKPTIGSARDSCAGASDDPRAIARALGSIGISGDIGEVSANDAGYKFDVARRALTTRLSTRASRVKPR